MLKDPEAKDKMTSSTFLFAPCCPYSVVANHLEAAFPAIYVGNDLKRSLRNYREVLKDTWDSFPDQDRMDVPIEDTLQRYCDATFATVTIPPLRRVANHEFRWWSNLAIRWLKNGNGQ